MKRIFYIISVLTVVFFISCSKEVPELEPCNSHYPDPDCVCTFLFDPVCGCDGVTYPNPCVAECSGIYVYSKGKCKN